MPNETELKKAWNLIIDYCDKTSCSDCLFDTFCFASEPHNNDKMEISDEK